jgi:Asp/Glu/hydantoin racemase
MLDTAFPRIRGDVGCAETFAFPVRFATVPGATVDGVVHRSDAGLLPLFVGAASALAAQGCIGIATTCGFMARWQRELADAVSVPVLTSVLMQVPLIAATLPAGKRVGIVTYSATDLTPELLRAAGIDDRVPIEGVDPGGYFARTIRDGATVLDRARMEADTVAAARRVVDRHRDLGALVLECANMPPYRDAVRDAVRLPVFDAAQCIAWFHAGLARPG